MPGFKRLTTSISAAMAFTMISADLSAEGVSEAQITEFRDWSVQQVIVPNYKAAQVSASDLQMALEEFCSDGDADPLAAFDDALAAYQAVQWINFGPAFLFDRRYRLNLWPDDSNAVSRQLGGALSNEPEEILTLDGLQDGNIALQGFSALERLLHPDLPQPGSYSCRLSTAVAGGITRTFADILLDWDRIDVMPQIGVDTYLQTVITNLAGHLDAIAARKIATPLGSEPEDFRPRRTENRRSENALSNIAVNLDAASAIIIGGANTGLDHLLETVGAPAEAADLVLRFESASALLNQLGDGAFESVAETAEGREGLLAIARALDEVRFTLRDEVAPALGVIVGFNSLDGD